MKNLLRLAAILLLALPCFAQQYDVLIRNGHVVDGAGNPWFRADIGIIGDRIAFIGNADQNVKAKRTIDAKGMIVAPGFIDMLGQSEWNLLVDKQAVSKITQGVTTEVTGEGESISPMDERTMESIKDWAEHYHVSVDWHSLNEYFKRLEQQGSGINLGTFVGATSIRESVIGRADRAPTPEELKNMQIMVEDAMFDGALGVSTALMYAPASYSKTDELIALAKMAQKYGGIYASHIRNEGDTEMQSLDEIFRIARDANIPCEIFHLKVAGQQNWGKMQAVVDAIQKARDSGLDITANQYPYIAAATSLGATIPPKYHEGGTDAFMGRLKDAQQRAQIREDLKKLGAGYENMWIGTGSADSNGGGILVASVLSPQLKRFEGKTIAQAAQMESKDALDELMDMVVADHDNTGAIYFEMKETDVRIAMRQPWVSVGTDHPEVSPTGPLSEGKAHPRGYGSFARILGKYVREEKVVGLEDAIRKFTSLPAQQAHLDHRGLLRTDYFADIAIFDPESVIDVSTFEDPNRISRGINYVLVNGVVEIDDGKITGQLGGRPVRGPGWISRGTSSDGPAPHGMLRGFVSDESGWPLPRTHVSLINTQGQEVAGYDIRKDGRFEMAPPAACWGCRVKAERMGFESIERQVDYNGTNSLWLAFPLKRLRDRK